MPGVRFLEEQPRNGHQHDVEGGDKTGLAGSSGLNALLLQVHRQSQRDAAAEAADDKVLVILPV